MKRQSILFVRSMCVVILFITLAACKDTDNRVFGDDFDFPALTDENTIRFTVNVVGDWRQLDIVASGGRMVIDWGNGRIQKIEKGELDRMPEVKEVDAECCGQHEVCERDSLLAAVSKKIEYYDDEELDQFIGRPGNAYTEEETDMFRDVLYTTLDIEVAGWVRSLQLRGIELPDDLKDEVFLIIGERRNGNS